VPEIKHFAINDGSVILPLTGAPGLPTVRPASEGEMWGVLTAVVVLVGFAVSFVCALEWRTFRWLHAVPFLYAMVLFFGAVALGKASFALWPGVLVSGAVFYGVAWLSLLSPGTRELQRRLEEKRKLNSR
jgi:hypothetical protein